MIFTATELKDAFIIDLERREDERGFFARTFCQQEFEAHGLLARIVQANMSYNRHKGTLRGLHCQEPFGQGKLVHVLDGEVFDVAVDVRHGSPTFGRWVGEVLSADNHRQIYIPPGFAHGFCVLSETALFAYKCTEYYHPEAEFSVAWNDPALAIDWPLRDPMLSRKDADAPRLADLARERLPVFEVVES